MAGQEGVKLKEACPRLSARVALNFASVASSFRHAQLQLISIDEVAKPANHGHKYHSNMTAAVHRTSTPSLSVPPSQNTAPVLEFNCLYTHDVRRKQKRWQDGFLRFHTFNKRVMVYDVPRNFIGDMHWAAGEPVQEGDEMTLDKDGVMVQVAERVGRTETDLTELRQSAKKQSRQAGNGSSSPARSSMATPSRAMPPPATRTATTGPGTQLKHRSLNALLGAPKGPIGKAMLPAKSPFEMRHRDVENADWEEGRAPKRQRTEPWNVVRTTTTPKPTSKETPLWARTSDAKASAKKAKKKAALPAGQQRLGTKEIIDLSEDGDDAPTEFLSGFSSDAVVPPSSPSRDKPPAPAKRAVRSSPPPPIQRTARRQATGSTVTIPDQSKASHAVDSLPGRPGVRQQMTLNTRESSATPPIAPPFLPAPSAEPAQTLRFTSSAPKKKTLACFDQLSRPSQSKRKTQRELLEERLQRAKEKVKQQEEDLDAVIADAEATDDSMERNTKTPDMVDTSELTRVDQVKRLAVHPEPKTLAQPSSKPPEKQPDSETAPTRRSRAAERVISGSDAHAAPQRKRTPGAPVRFTPSPTRRAALNEQRSRRGSTASVQSLPETEPSPSKASKKPSPEPALTSAKPPTARPPSPPHSPAKPTADDPPQHPVESMPPPAKPPRRKPGIGRKEIRKSAQACFPTALNTAAANGTSTVMLSKPFSAPKPPEQPKSPPTSKEAGPWSREAFDLFAWRPPNWDEDEWRVKKDAAAAGDAA